MATELDIGILLAFSRVLKKREWPIVLLLLSSPGPWRIKDLRQVLPWINQADLSRAWARLKRDGVIHSVCDRWQIAINPSSWGGEHAFGGAMAICHHPGLAGNDGEMPSPIISTIKITDLDQDPERDLSKVGSGNSGGVGGTSDDGKSPSRPGKRQLTLLGDDGESPSSPGRGEIPTGMDDGESPSLSRQERLILHELETTSGYPYSYPTDLEHVRKLLVDYPEIDLLEEIKLWKAWLTHNPLRKKSRPRVQTRNWCINATKKSRGTWGKRGRGQDVGHEPSQGGTSGKPLTGGGFGVIGPDGHIAQ